MKSAFLRKARSLVPHHLHYYPLHFAFFVIFSLFGGFLIQRIEGDINFADALFTATSACCVTGLITLDTSLLKPGSQVVIWLWLMIGSTVLFSVLPVFIRGIYYHRFIRKQGRFSPAVVEMEYLALKKLMWIIPSYYACNIFAVFILLLIYNTSATKLPDARNVNPVWASLFLGGSSFANAGFSVYADNVIGYQRHPFVLFVLMYGILAGNTAFPLLLWCIIQFRRKVLSHFISSDTEIYDYLIEHPRRCFTHLFPSRATLWLLVLVVSFNLIQFAFAAGFNWNQPTLAGLGPGLKLINSLFQSVSTRTAGFNSVDISTSNPGILVLTLVMMYVSSYPVVLTLRSSREEAWEVSEEEEQRTERKPSIASYRSSISIERSAAASPNTTAAAAALSPSGGSSTSVAAANRKMGEANGAHPAKPAADDERTLRGQARRLFLREAAIVFLGYFIISLIEADHYYAQPLEYNLFKILFEVVSAFGTVGLSLGFPGLVVSFAGKLHKGSKLILVIVMLFGRHRGLPDILDAAITFDSAEKRSIALQHRQIELKSRNYDNKEEEQEVEEETKSSSVAAPGTSVPTTTPPPVVLTKD